MGHQERSDAGVSPAKPANPPLDSRDRLLLELLQRNAKTPERDLAHAIGLSVTGVRRRLRKLRRHGVIENTVALLERNALGLGLLCWMEVHLNHQLGNGTGNGTLDFLALVQDLPEVLECYELAGAKDLGHRYLLKLVVHDHLDVATFQDQELGRVAGFRRTLTCIVLNETKNTTALPLNLPAETSPEPEDPRA